MKKKAVVLHLLFADSGEHHGHDGGAGRALLRGAPGDHQFDSVATLPEDLRHLLAAHPEQVGVSDPQDVVPAAQTAILIQQEQRFKPPSPPSSRTRCSITALPWPPTRGSTESRFLFSPFPVAVLVSSVTWSAMPPGRMVFTMTPEVFPPTIPKPRPVPSLTSSIVSRCSNCHSQQSTINTRTALAPNVLVLVAAYRAGGD